MHDKETVIRISADGTVSVEKNTDGTISHKKISPDTLLECVRGSAVRDTVRSGILPPDCISFAEDDRGNRTLYLLYPKDKADITFMDTVYENFPIPRLVFGFTLDGDGRVSGCRLGVTENAPKAKPDAKMYRWPFSNVNGTHLCLGNNALPKYGEPHRLAGLPHHILSMPHNMDNFAEENNRPRLGMRELLDYMKDKTAGHYYGHVLIESGKTLGEFVG